MPFYTKLIGKASFAPHGNANWERELDLLAFRPKIIAYWASGPDHRQPNTRQYQQLRTNAASREIARAKGERYLPGAHHLVTADAYRAHFSTAPLPAGASVWYHSLTALGGWVKSNKLRTPPDVTLYAFWITLARS